MERPPASLPLICPLLLLLPLALAQPPSDAGSRAPVALPSPLIHIDSSDGDVDDVVVLGSTRRLTCYASGVDDAGIKVVWYKNGAKVDSSFAVGESPDGQLAVVNEMQFRVVTSDIGAAYECRIQVGEQTPPSSATVRLDVIGPPTVDGYEAGRQVSLGEQLNLTCQSISGGPSGGDSDVTVAWYRSGSPLSGATTRRTAAGVRPPRVTSILSVLVDAEAAQVPFMCRVSHPKYSHRLEADVNLLVSLPYTVPPVTNLVATTEEHCKVSPLVDFVFVLDSSSSIKPPDFQRQKQFLKDFVKEFDVDGDVGTRFGVVQFGTREKLEFHLGAHGSRDAVLEAVGKIRQTGVETYLDRGLRFYREQMRRPANGARPAARSVVVIVTDGDATDKDAAHAEAKLVRSTGAEVWAIGVGDVKKEELLAATARQDRTFYATNYDALLLIIGQFVEAAKKQCERAQQPPPTQAVRPPPGAPRLLLYVVGDPVIMGDDYEIECLSPGGDDMTDVIWYKDGLPVDRTHRHEQAGAFNHHRLRVDPSDQKATYTCSVSHPLLTQSLDLSFVFPIIDKPKIVGYDRGKSLLVGAVVKLVCFSTSTAADVVMTWHKNGARIADAPAAEVLDLSIIGELEVTVSTEDDLNEYSCQISHPKLRQPLSTNVHLVVEPVPTVPPPGRPEVSATPPDHAYVGVEVTMTCTSEGADPGTALSWYRNGVKVASDFSIVGGSRVVNTYVFVARAVDIGSRYDCLVENGRTNTSQLVNLPYVIKYRPAGPPVIAGYGGAPLEPNSTVTLTCRSKPARPDSRLVWRRNGEPLAAAAATETRLDEAGDFVASELQLTGAEYVAHGDVYSCHVVTLDDGDILDPLAQPSLSDDEGNGVADNVTLVVKVHGGWSDWRASSPCSVTCGGGGAETYARRCVAPEPKNGGDACRGPATETRPCSTPATCPTTPPPTTTTTTAAPTTPPAKGCDLLRGPLDVAFAIDSSDSVYERDFQQVVHFAARLAAKFNVSSGQHRVGALLFGRSPRLLFPLGQHARLADLQGALLSMRQRMVRGDATNTAAALRYVRHVLFGGAMSRSNASRLVIVITDAHSHDPQATAAEARRMRAAGILTVAMGIVVRSDDQDELRAIAGSAARALQARSYSELPQLVHDLPTALRACKMPAEPCDDETDSDDDDLYPEPDDRAYEDRWRPGCPASCRDSRRRCDGATDRRRGGGGGSWCGPASRSGYCRYACDRRQDRGRYDRGTDDDYGYGGEAEPAYWKR